MTYVGRGGKVWSMPSGAELVGVGGDGVPLYFNGTGLAPMVQVVPRRLGQIGDTHG